MPSGLFCHISDEVETDAGSPDDHGPMGEVGGVWTGVPASVENQPDVCCPFCPVAGAGHLSVALWSPLFVKRRASCAEWRAAIAGVNLETLQHWRKRHLDCTSPISTCTEHKTPTIASYNAFHPIAVKVAGQIYFRGTKAFSFIFAVSIGQASPGTKREFVYDARLVIVGCGFRFISLPEFCAACTGQRVFGLRQSACKQTAGKGSGILIWPAD